MQDNREERFIYVNDLETYSELKNSNSKMLRILIQILGKVELLTGIFFWFVMTYLLKIKNSLFFYKNWNIWDYFQVRLTGHTICLQYSVGFLFFAFSSLYSAYETHLSHWLTCISIVYVLKISLPIMDNSIYGLYSIEVIVYNWSQ